MAKLNWGTRFNNSTISPRGRKPPPDAKAGPQDFVIRGKSTDPQKAKRREDARKNREEEKRNANAAREEKRRAMNKAAQEKKARRPTQVEVVTKRFGRRVRQKVGVLGPSR